MKTKKKKILKVLMYIYVIALTAYLCASCSTCEQLARRCPPQVSRSETLYVHDTTIITRWKTDTALITALFDELARVVVMETDSAHAETTYAVADSWIEGNHIELVLRNKPKAPVQVPVFHEKEEQRHEETKQEKITEVQTVYKTRGIVKVFMWIGIAAVILIVLYIILWILKKR